MKMMTFPEWLVIREGLWLNDDKAEEGLSKLPQPKPNKPSQRKPLTQTVRLAKPQVRPVLPKFSIAPTKNGRPMVARIDGFLFARPDASGSGGMLRLTTTATNGNEAHDGCTDAEYGEGGGFGNGLSTDGIR